MIVQERSSAWEASRTNHDAQSPPQPVIRIGSVLVPAEVGGRLSTAPIFTMTLGDETIHLLPLKTWSQLDIFKWRVQGKLPATPAGLEIAADHVKLAGETIWTTDPDGCERLERLFNQWLALEREALEVAAQKAQAPEPVARPEPAPAEPLRIRVERDKTGQPHILCLEGKDTAANVALTVPGLTSLFAQGLMRQPAAWKIGALRDWIELDGQVFRFQNGGEDLQKLERVLNERYLPASDPDSAPDVQVFLNPASSSGFDIQFPAADLGLAENRRRHLDAQAMEVLSDPQRCRVLRKGIVVKLAPPHLVFKQRTPNGGEQELPASRATTVEVVGADGRRKAIDLSQPVSHFGLGVSELMAIFNHPAINRRASRSQSAEEAET